MRSRYLTEDEIGRLAARVGRDKWLPFLLMLETGVRVGDAAKARRRDFYRDAGGVPRFRWVAEKTGKAGDAEVSERVFAAATAGKGRPTAWVFPGRGKAGHITRQALWARVKHAARAGGVDDLGASPHSLRKVAAVRVRRSEGFRAAKAAMQHSRDATAAIYAFSDAMAAPDEPITWGELEIVAEFVAEKVRRGLDKAGEPPL